MGDRLQTLWTEDSKRWHIGRRPFGSWRRSAENDGDSHCQCEKGAAKVQSGSAGRAHCCRVYFGACRHSFVSYIELLFIVLTVYCVNLYNSCLQLICCIWVRLVWVTAVWSRWDRYGRSELYKHMNAECIDWFRYIIIFELKLTFANLQLSLLYIFCRRYLHVKLNITYSHLYLAARCLRV